MRPAPASVTAATAAAKPPRQPSLSPPGTGSARRHRTIPRLSTQLIAIRLRQFVVYDVSKLPSPFPTLFYSDHRHQALEDANEMVFVLQEVLS